MIVCGIDPGLAGGLALLSREEQWAIPLPHRGKEVDVRALVDALPPPLEVACVMVERLGVRPGQSVQSGVTQGTNHGRITGALEVMGYSVRLVRPQDWKAKVLKGTKKDKADAIAFVQRAYPAVNLIPGKCKVPQDGLADAMCIAECARLTLEW
jgi:crossover junction endodeoxyribonuclease RuvC